MKAHVHLACRDAYIGRGIDEVAKDVARLRVNVYKPKIFANSVNT